LAMQVAKELDDYHRFVHEQRFLMKIVVEDEISLELDRAYDDYLHKVVYPPSRKAKVTALIGDGHCKVMGREKTGACNLHRKRSGPPRKTKNIGKGRKTTKQFRKQLQKQFQRRVLQKMVLRMAGF